MRIIRRIGMAAAAGVLMGAVVSGPASAADRPETYVGSATGKALNLQVGSTKATLGQSAARIDSTLKAAADSAGVLGLPVVGGSNAGPVEVSGNGTSQATGEKCAVAEPSQLSAVLNIGAGCSSSAVQVVNNLPVAVGEGSVANIDLDAQSILKTPVSALQPTVETLFGQIDAIADRTGRELNLNSTVSEVLTALGTTRTLEVRLGASKSSVTNDGSKVTSLATSQAGRITILPLGAAGLEPVAEIIIGSAEAKAIYDRATGVSTPSFDPAIVTIRLNTPTTDAAGAITGVSLQEIKITPGSLVNIPTAAACDEDAKSVCILKGTPFETRITVASGRTVTNPDGTVGAVADAVAIHALRNIGSVVSQLQGGILFELAHAEAGVGGLTPQVSIVPDLPRELPRTGGLGLLPMMGGSGLAAAILGRRFLALRNR